MKAWAIAGWMDTLSSQYCDSFMMDMIERSPHSCAEIISVGSSELAFKTFVPLLLRFLSILSLKQEPSL